VTPSRALYLLMFLATAVAQSSPQPSGFAREMLDAHNAVRARVGVPMLSWSNQLASAAQAWADTLLRRGRFQHQSRSPYGENLFEIQGGAADPREVIDAWASESAHYDNRKNRCRGECGHYTQLVWRSTSQVGCAVARGKGREIWVCEYNQPGNIVGRRAY
jgi:uncharacterized protein YkwD